MVGCLGSEAPLFEQDKASVKFEPRLTGTWEAYLEARPTEVRTLTITPGDDKNYLINQKGQDNLVEAHVVRVMGYDFITMKELPPVDDGTEPAPVVELDPYYYYALLKETVYDLQTGAVVLTLGTSQDPQFIESFIGRHTEFGLTAKKIEAEGNKVGKLILQGETAGLRDAFAALGDTVDGFGAELKLHLVPVKEKEAAAQ